MLVAMLGFTSMHGIRTQQCRRTATPNMSADPAKVYRRAQFWESETATLEDIANVIGRWSSATEWGERVKFAAPTARRVDSMAQAATLERYE